MAKKKIKVRSGRGTRIIEVDEDASKWSGEDFKKIQEARKAAQKQREELIDKLQVATGIVLAFTACIIGIYYLGVYMGKF